MKMSGSDEDSDFHLPLRFKTKVRGKAKPFTIADEPTLSKILQGKGPRTLQPEFKGNDYVRGVKNEEKQIFKCEEPQCGEKFTNETSLKFHMRKHLDRKAPCEFCGGLFKDVEERAKHLDEFHPDLERYPDADPLQCKKCNKISRDKRALRRHILEAHRPQAFPCPECQFPFTSPDNLKAHLKLKHPPKDVPVAKWPCGICGKEYAQKNNFAAHIKSSHRGERGASYRCVLCQVVYDNKASYRKHMRRHVDPKFFPCKVCNVQFGTMSHYKRHVEGRRHREMAARQGKNEEEEPEATNMEATASELKSETGPDPGPDPGPDQDKPEEKKPFTQEELIASCQAKVIKIKLVRVDSQNLTRPSVNHAMASYWRKKGRQYLNCIYCDLRLPNLKGVKSHEAICLMKKQNKKLHICPHPHCNKEFDKASILARHSKTHSEDRPFQCSYCDTKFKNEANKVQHEKAIHFGIRGEPKPPQVFRCSRQDCRKLFSTAKSLRRHWNSVHLEITHPCGTCRKVFKRQEQLQKHQREEHAKKPMLLPCKVCKRTYRNRGALLAHFQTRRHQQKSRELCRKQFGNKEEEMKDNPQEEKEEEEPSNCLPSITSIYSLKDVKTCPTANDANIIPEKD